MAQRRDPGADRDYARERVIRSIAGLAVALGGCALAIVRPGQEWLGIIAALIGAGLVEPTLLLPFLTQSARKEKE